MKNALKDFGPIYVINLKSREDRLEHIKKEFNKHNVKDYTIIEAVDGSTQDLSLLVENAESLNVSNNEIACTISHLKAIKHWLDTSKSDYAIIMEDDLVLETVNDWQWTWNEFLSKINLDYNMLQLSITNNGGINTSLHYRESRDYSASCYLIKREWAQVLINTYIYQDKVNFKKMIGPAAVTDYLIYHKSICLAFPLFTYSLDFTSSIDQSHVDTFHKKSRDQVLSFWKTKPKTLYRKLIIND
jgi:GR25 family glycosyltransferase involved in LPS biosynthesis